VSLERRRSSTSNTDNSHFLKLQFGCQLMQRKAPSAEASENPLAQK
jgi:hypothetical protein